MQKIEKWRIQELAQLLRNFSHMLREGNNIEWANVFHHYSEEAIHIVQQKRFNLAMLQRLVVNIRNCFDQMSSLHNLELSPQNFKEMEDLNREFLRAKALLYQLLSRMENKWIEYIN